MEKCDKYNFKVYGDKCSRCGATRELVEDYRCGEEIQVKKVEPIKIKAIPLPHDPVNHPTHYTSDPSGVECIQITQHRNFCVGNAIKYLWRAGLKGDAHVEDLEKAIFYINQEIERIKNEG